MRRRLNAKIVGRCECSGAIVIWIRGAVPTDTLTPQHARMIDCPNCDKRLIARITHVYESRRKARKWQDPAEATNP